MPAIGGVVSAHQNSETRGECFKIVSRASLIGCAGLALWPFLGSTQGGKPSEAPWLETWQMAPKKNEAPKKSLPK
ncbi:MFS transporter [Aspergillus luchuensis]|uniref:MFS transporter n=1 Tax=Aspergillus kawachii TaxID=1069201 RepID=A0A146FY46_ASPKA|nr:MFS transporter [Aspergillus luchuensis]